MTMTGTLTIAELESFYDRLAETLDAAGPQGSEKLLIKLALLLADQAREPSRLGALIEQAAQDL